MRSFSFHAKTIGKERYLTYIMGEGMELDEDTLDVMEEQDFPELVRVIFERNQILQFDDKRSLNRMRIMII